MGCKVIRSTDSVYYYYFLGGLSETCPNSIVLTHDNYICPGRTLQCNVTDAPQVEWNVDDTDVFAFIARNSHEGDYRNGSIIDARLVTVTGKNN